LQIDRASIAVVIALMLAACGDESKVPAADTVGPDPVLPEPTTSLIPTVNVAGAVGWPPDGMPLAADGLAVSAFAKGLDHPRWLYLLPNGDVLVAETNAPPKPDEGGGIRGWFFAMFQEEAGAAVPSANRITLLRDTDNDGVADLRTPFIQGLNSPFGMALVGNSFYVANTDAILRFEYRPDMTRIEGPGTKIADMPAGTLNHHWTKNLIASRDGKRLYATVGSNSNVGENGLELEQGRAAILEIDPVSGQTRIFASGLRNPNGLGWETETGALWTVVNERDELGSDLVPDYLTSVRDGGFYGWPYSYYGQHVDDRVEPQDPALVASAIKPDYALGNHVAPLGLAFSEGTLLPPRYRGGVFIGQHGSWNREPLSGYNVVFIPFSGGRPIGKPVEILSGFVNEEEDEAYGRPVGVAFDGHGALLVADDVGNAIWRVTPAP
jgi:glucose/arabinose dehydrogenase